MLTEIPFAIDDVLALPAYHVEHVQNAILNMPSRTVSGGRREGKRDSSDFSRRRERRAVSGTANSIIQFA